jgi:Cdc6-like AAA superfamily ATPase
MAIIRREQIINAFIPSKEITNANLFVGRKEEIQNVLDALYSKGTHIAIIGGRGIGKTSLARQVYDLAEGNNTILEKLSLPNDGKLGFLPIYYACGNDVKTINDLLNRLMTTKDCLADWVYNIQTSQTEKEKINGGIDIKVAKIGSDEEKRTTSEKAINSHKADVIFQNVLKGIIADVANEGILIIIDEFDQIENTSGFAKLLKAMATNVPKVKFCIVGVAQDIQNLMQEHSSTDRTFAGGVINLPYMSEVELNEIIDNAEKEVENSIVFETSARQKIIELASGHSYLVHLIGKHALLIAYNRKQSIVNEEIIEQTIVKIAEKGIDHALDTRYKKAVSNSFDRESVLKALSLNIQTNDTIVTSTIYKEVKAAGIENPSSYVGHLASEKYGAEIIKDKDEHYRFKDSLFAAYVKARPWITLKNK